MEKIKNEEGLLSLEASICLTLFIFLMLFLYSYFVVFEARNVMAHGVLATADSLSIEVYQTNKVDDDGLAEVISSIINFAFKKDNSFRTTKKWYKNDDPLSTDWNGNIYVPSSTNGEDKEFKDEFGNSAYESTLFEEVLKERFFAYLTGSDKKEEIEAYLEKYHIVGGMDGVSFAGSKIIGNDLYVQVTYKLDYEFDVADLMNITFTQSACSKLWK